MHNHYKIVASMWFFLSVVFHSSHCIECHIRPDNVYSGDFVDCSSRRLTPRDLDQIPAAKTTSLVINHNNFGSLPDNAFIRFRHLRSLRCLWCSLGKLGVDTLKGLNELEILDLTCNHLRISGYAFPRGFFRHVTNLKQLFIGENDNDGTSSAYSKYIDFFDFLPELTHLGIDSFSTLVIGEEFLTFRKLYSIQLHGPSSITNDSLNGFQNSTVKEFEMLFCSSITHLGTDVFQFLPNVSHLSLSRLRIGNRNALRMMRPLRGRRIDTIEFNHLQFSVVRNLEDRITDSTITAQAAEYLGSICVSNFYWYDSHIISLETEAIMTPTWMRRLKQITIETTDMLMINNILLFELVRLKQLETLLITRTGNKLVDQFWALGFGAQDKTKELLSIANSSNDDTYSRIDEGKPGHNVLLNGKQKKYAYYSKKLRRSVKFSSKHGNDSKSDRIPNDVTTTSILKRNQDKPSALKNISLLNEMKMNQKTMKLKGFSSNVSRSMILTLPPNLRTLRIDGIHSVRLHPNQVVTINYNRVESLAFTYVMYYLCLYGKVLGLDHLTTLNFQEAKLTLAVDFFDKSPSLKKLILRKCLVPHFFETNSKRLLQNISTLEYLDLAGNGLQRLASETFHGNKNLKYLCLASNRLSSIPFNLKLTPRLEILDLRWNAFVDLSPGEMAALDDHIRVVSNFIIMFDNNQMSCACSTLPFIGWLQKHLVHFDQGGNYTCISEEGTLSNTASYKDVAGFWRRCHGLNYFLFSLILACAIVAGYLAVFLGMKNKTQIVSQVMKLVVPGFSLKTRHDFRYDVCIGYSNQDGLYVRNVLLRYLEDAWRLRTFVHQRDLMQDNLLMTQALQDSWRCLLLITEDFLFRYDMAHNVMKVASFFVNPTNPSRVVVLVEGRVQHQIPDYVLQVVDEDNIIVLPEFRGLLDYEVKEFLRTRLAD